MYNIRSKIVLLIFVSVSSGMLVKDWGTGSQVNYLAYSTYDLFQGAFNILTAAQNNVYPVQDFTCNYPQEWRGINTTVDFHAYNGWLDSLTLEMDTGEQFGKLRRFIMTSMNSNNIEKNFQHEIFMCANCISLKAKGFHFAFESTYHKYETTGTIDNGPIQFFISFQMTVVSDFNATINRQQCTTNLEPITMTLDPESRFCSKVKGVKIFSFISNYLDVWMTNHFTQTVLASIQQQMDLLLRKVLNRQNICDQFLSS